MRLLGVVLAIAGCGRIGFDLGSGSPTDSAAPDVLQPCSAYGPYQSPVHVPELSSAVYESAPSLTADQLYVVFERDTGSDTNLYEASRPDGSAPFSMPISLAAVNTVERDERDPSLSPDGLTLYYTSTDVPANGSDIMVATRPDRDSPFGAPTELAIAVTFADDVFAPEISDDGQELIFNRFIGVPQNSNLMHAIWDPGLGQFVSPTDSGFLELTIGATATDYSEAWAGLSSDRLTIYFVGRPSASNAYDTYTASRPRVDAPFGSARMMSEIAVPGSGTGDPEPSADGLTLWLGSERPGGVGDVDIWRSTRVCL